MPRAHSSIQKDLARNDVPPPPIPLSPRETAHYCRVIAAIPSHNARNTVVQSIAASMAQTLAEIEDASATIERDGLTVTSAHGVKAHPCIQMRDAAHKRLAALASRLKALPSGDAREAQRLAAYESRARGPVALTVVRPDPALAGDAVDWVALAAQEQSTLIEEAKE